MVFQCACICTNGCISQKVPLPSAALWSVVLPVLLLYKHADECCEQCFAFGLGSDTHVEQFGAFPSDL